jgi:hypothetical protein
MRRVPEGLLGVSHQVQAGGGANVIIVFGFLWIRNGGFNVRPPSRDGYAVLRSTRCSRRISRGKIPANYDVLVAAAEKAGVKRHANGTPIGVQKGPLDYGWKGLSR